MSRYEEFCFVLFFSYGLCIGTCFCSQLCMSVRLLSGFTFYCKRLFCLTLAGSIQVLSFKLTYKYQTHLKNSLCHYRDIHVTDFLLEHGQQQGALTLLPKWLCLTDKLKFKLYTVRPRSTSHSITFKRHSHQYLTSSYFLFLFNR